MDRSRLHPLVRTVVLALAGCLVCIGCRQEPDIVELSPATEAVATTLPEAPSPAPEPEAVSPPTSPSEAGAPATIVDEVQIIETASAFLEALRSGDREVAASMWSGYPHAEDERPLHLANLAAAHPWMNKTDLRLEVVQAWAFEPEGSMPIVVITDPEHTGVATLLFDGAGVIQRIDSLAFQALRPATITDNVIVIDGLPLEGSANGYLDGVLLDDPIVDYAAVTTTFALPASPGQREVLVTSWATPEFPFVTARILDRG